MNVNNIYSNYRKKYCEFCCGCDKTQGIPFNELTDTTKNSAQDITNEQIFKCTVVRKVIHQLDISYNL